MSQLLDDIKIDTIDFQWIKNTKKISHLKRAIRIIEEDGDYYKQLKDACYQRMEQIDPSFKRIQFKNNISQTQKQEIQNQLQAWELNINNKNTKPKQKKQLPQLEDIQKYFDNQITNDKSKISQRAQKQKVKGNQALKSKDYDQAITYYTNSINLDSTMHQSYGNRALAYLKKKQFNKCISDCDKALQLNKTYTKAMHRKGKALIQLKKKVQAYRCFKQISKLQPQNTEINKQMMQLRQMMSQKQIKQLQSSLISKSQFKKITIEEDSDEDQQINQNK